MDNKFLSYFPDHVYRYIDLSGSGRPPISSAERKDDLNLNGYESYFTVNGFCDTPNAKKENCSNLNAFFVDIDGRKDPAELERIKQKLDPTFITETKNGYHIFWLLDEPIYKNEMTPKEWETATARWEKIEARIVIDLDADKAVKDIPRILRVPDTYYWKKTGAKYIEGTEGIFKIKGLYKELNNTYSMAEVESVFTGSEVIPTISEVAETQTNKARENSDKERDTFFEKVAEMFPFEERDSFKALISAEAGSLPLGYGRNNALHTTACLMRQAGWSKERAVKQIENSGWHGMEKEPSGASEIYNTINSAYNSKKTYSPKNEIIAHNVSIDETQRLQEVYVKVSKLRKDRDKLRFSTYEKEILIKHPYLRSNEIGLIFNYRDGVYVPLTDQEVYNMFFVGLEEDLLLNFRTKRNISDKIACLHSIIPRLVISDDKGYIANVKNGLLNILTGELSSHTPAFVSLIQYPVNFDPKATAPIWERCISEWMSGAEQENKIRLLKQFCGYLLSSSMLHDKALFMVGDGGNGKSTFIDTIAMVIGNTATSHIDLESLYGDFGMHGLIGKRLNIIEEVSGNYYQANKLKKLVSGEKVTIDIKYKPQFTFRPQAKFVFSVNLLPRVDDTSTATERRILAVTFLNNYRDNPNEQLRSDVGLLARELPGILNWMIEGAIDLAEQRSFVITEEQIAMLDEYREENSSVEGFLSQCIVTNRDDESRIDTTTLYAEYKRWSATDGGRKCKANITFTKEVIAYGKKRNRFTYESRKGGGGTAIFVGIELSPQWLRQYDNNQVGNY